MTFWKTGAALAAIVIATTAAHAQTAPESSETTASPDAGNDIVVVGQAVRRSASPTLRSPRR